MIWLRNLLLFAVSFFVSASLCCKDLDPQVALFECRVQALRPLVGNARAAQRLIQDAEATGELDLTAAAEAVGKGRADALAALKRLQECSPPAPVPDAGLSGS